MGVLYKNTKINNIIDAVMKIDGKIVNNLPLQMKIDGVIINFMMYGPTLEEIKMLMPISPIGFDAEKISNIINSLGKFADSIEVTFENGEFICNKPLIITTSNVALMGESNTILKCNGDFSNYNNDGYYGVLNFKGKSETELENLVVEGISIDGDRGNNSHKSYGIYCSYVGSSTKKGITIKDCVIKNNNIGIYLIYFSSNNIIKGNTCNNNNNIGVYLNTSSNNIITSNNINNNGYGIYLSASKNNSISSNIITNNSSGIRVPNSNNNAIIDNKIFENSSDGICILEHSSYNNIVGNNINENIGHGINLYLNSYSNNNTITGNNISDNKNNGIYLYSSNINNIVQGNVCRGNSIHNITNEGTDNKLNFNIT